MTITPLPVPVILSGGVGTRLWPLSRHLLPKQYHPLVGDRPMLVETVARLTGVADLDQLTVVCHHEHRFLVAQQLHQHGFTSRAILLEPEGRNTAPAVAVAALHLKERLGPHTVLLILPADHFIQDLPAFQRAIHTGMGLAQQGELVTFGIPPTAPETGFGYIQRGEALVSDTPAWRVLRFVEKPPRPHAEQMLLSGDFLWNSGIFMFQAQRILDELARHAPDLLQSIRNAVQFMQHDLDFLRLHPDSFAAAPAISLDYAVMEKAQQVAMVPLQAGWSDLGSWHALWEALPKDENQTACHGDVLAMDCHNALIFSSSRMVGAIGLDNMVVVETPDAVLVLPKHRSQEVKLLVDRLRLDKREEAQSHLTVYRPWGHFECVDRADQFQVKRITVHPHAILSMQRHRQRAEHWIVVRGRAKVTCDNHVFFLQQNQSTYIPVGSIHRLENPDDHPLEIIEVQSGDYLGEDDIERFEDLYGR